MNKSSSNEEQIKLTSIQHSVGTELIVLFDFFKDTDKYLQLKKGDLITLVKETKISEENSWWKGLCKGKIGYFPSNFVSLKNTPSKTEDNIEKTEDSNGDISSTLSRKSEYMLPIKELSKKKRSSSFSRGDVIISKNDNKKPTDLKLNLNLLNENANKTEKPKSAKKKTYRKKKGKTERDKVDSKSKLMKNNEISEGFYNLQKLSENEINNEANSTKNNFSLLEKQLNSSNSPKSRILKGTNTLNRPPSFELANKNLILEGANNSSTLCHSPRIKNLNIYRDPQSSNDNSPSTSPRKSLSSTNESLSISKQLQFSSPKREHAATTNDLITLSKNTPVTQNSPNNKVSPSPNKSPIMKRSSNINKSPGLNKSPSMISSPTNRSPKKESNFSTSPKSVTISPNSEKKISKTEKKKKSTSFSTVYVSKMPLSNDTSDQKTEQNDQKSEQNDQKFHLSKKISSKAKRAKNLSLKIDSFHSLKNEMEKYENENTNLKEEEKNLFFQDFPIKKKRNSHDLSLKNHTFSKGSSKVKKLLGINSSQEISILPVQSQSTPQDLNIPQKSSSPQNHLTISFGKKFKLKFPQSSTLHSQQHLLNTTYNETEKYWSSKRPTLLSWDIENSKDERVPTPLIQKPEGYHIENGTSVHQNFTFSNLSLIESNVNSNSVLSPSIHSNSLLTSDTQLSETPNKSNTNHFFSSSNSSAPNTPNSSIISSPNTPNSTPLQDNKNKDEISKWFDHHLTIPFYQKYLKDSSHVNYVGLSEKEGPVVVSISKDEEKFKKTEKVIKVLIRSSKNHCERILTTGKKSFNSVKPLLSERFDKVKWKKADTTIVPKLVNFENSNIILNYKFGVLYLKENQTENEAFSNQSSPDFDDFIDILGDRIQLKGWEKFRGGLDIKNGNTGDESVYAEIDEFCVMFHVSTLLPFHPEDPQKLERKRHIGNDVVNFVFKEGDTPFDPLMLRSQFNYIYIIVEKDVSSDEEFTRYRVSVASKPGVPCYQPRLQSPPIFEIPKKKSTEEIMESKMYFRNWLLGKGINGERAAMYAVDFRAKLRKTNTKYLQEMVNMF